MVSIHLVRYDSGTFLLLLSPKISIEKGDDDKGIAHHERKENEHRDP
jgi:hypothetical protein